MSESLFTKFFDAMQDRVARHDIEAEQLLERNFKKNKFSGKTTFTGIVMSDPGSTGTTQEGMVTANNFKPIKVFIEGIDDAMVDPLEIANSAPSEEQINMFNSVVGGLLTAYPSSELQGTDPTSQIQLGSKVELQFYDQGPQTANHGKMRGLRYIRVLNSSDSRYSAIAGQFQPVAASSFGADGGSIALTGDFEVVGSRLIEDLDPRAQTIMKQFEDAVKAEDPTIVLTYTSTYRSKGKQVNIEFNNVNNPSMGAEWYRKTYKADDRPYRQQMLANYLANPNNLERCIELNVPLLAGKGSAHMKRFGVDIGMVTKSWAHALIIETVAFRFMNAKPQKFAWADWELQSERKYPSNRARRKAGGPGVSGEHLHIGMNAQSSTSGQF